MSGIRSVEFDDLRETVTVEMEWDAAEFIGLELPQSDGFTRDWWQQVWKPISDRLDNA